MNENLVKLLSILLSSNTQAQIFHRQTKSFSEHMTLGTYYDEIIELVDDLTESAQGELGILSGYVAFPLVGYKDNAQVVGYFTDICKQLTELRKSIPQSYLQNQIDSIEELLYSTKYKLVNLK
jgi:hypothetical protein